MKGGEKNSDQLGTSESKEPSVFLCLIYPRLGTGEDNYLERPTGKDKKEPQEKHVLDSQRTMKGVAQQNRKLLDKIILLSPYLRLHRFKQAPPTEVKWEPRLPPSPGFDKVLPPPANTASEKAK